MEWLTEVFGFTRRLHHLDKDGQVNHAELAGPDGGTLLLGLDEPNPTQILVDVPDVDAHCERVRAAGFEIVFDPMDQSYGLRTYRVVDPHGYTWDFCQRYRDVAPEEWGAIGSQ
jgi:uncharacterized glyoxalase superfamily protein PhnB